MTTSPIRILHIFGRMNVGGAEMRTLELMQHTDRSVYQFDFCTLSGEAGTLDETIRDLGGQVIPCRLDARFPLRFLHLLRGGRYDIVHSHVYYFSGVILFLTALAGVRGRLAHFHSTYAGDASRLRRVQHRLTKGLIAVFATRIVAVSKETMRISWRETWARDPRCAVVYDGIDTSHYPTDVPGNRQRLRDLFGLKPDDKVIIHVGRFDPPKNHRGLIDIFAHVQAALPGTKLLLIGRRSGIIEQDVLKAVAHYGLHDHVIMPGERSDVPQLLSGADCLLFPSLWEGLPGVVLEACAAGLPVVASRIPSLIEIVAAFPHVRLVSLQAAPQDWVNCVRVQLGEAAKRDGNAITSSLNAFQQTPFSVDHSLKTLQAIWRDVAGRSP